MNSVLKQCGKDFWVFSLLFSMALGCGVDLKKPKTFFDGVDEKGYLTYIEEFDQLDLGDDFKLPMVGIFKSNREYQSPYFGQGWIMALLDSHFIALSENKFQMIQPDGLIRDFSRGNTQESVLSGSQGWKAEIVGDSITAYASCGWKLVYKNGKISEISNPQGRILTYEYKNGHVDQIREGIKTVLKVNWNDITNQVKGYEYGDKKTEVALRRDQGYKLWGLKR